MRPRQADVRHSASSWRQPHPPAASRQRDRLVDRVADRVLGLGRGRLLVGIDGHTAAGKTSFGHELAERIGAAGRPVLRATLDDFKKPWSHRHLHDRESGPGYYRNAYDYGAVTRLLLDPCRSPAATSCALCATDPLTQQNHASETTPIGPDAVLVVDGVFAFRAEINAYWDFRIWLRVPAELSLQRAAERDEAGSQAEPIHRDRYLAAEHVYLRDADPLSKVDVIIDNAVFARPRLVTP